MKNFKTIKGKLTKCNSNKKSKRTIFIAYELSVNFF